MVVDGTCAGAHAARGNPFGYPREGCVLAESGVTPLPIPAGKLRPHPGRSAADGGPGPRPCTPARVLTMFKTSAQIAYERRQRHLELQERITTAAYEGDHDTVWARTRAGAGLHVAVRHPGGPPYQGAGPRSVYLSQLPARVCAAFEGGARSVLRPACARPPCGAGHPLFKDRNLPYVASVLGKALVWRRSHIESGTRSEPTNFQSRVRAMHGRPPDGVGAAPLSPRSAAAVAPSSTAFLKLPFRRCGRCWRA